jgi:pilus assembly protein Flp/PilA
MMKFNKRLMASRKSQKGLTTVEYAIAGGLVAAAVLVGFQTLGLNVGVVIGNIATAIGNIPAP